MDKLVREKHLVMQSALLLSGLCVLCECHGVPIEQNQSKWCVCVCVTLIQKNCDDNMHNNYNESISVKY